MTTAVIVAGGSGARLPGEVPKQFRDLGGLPILDWSVRAFESHPLVDRAVVVLPADVASSPPDWLVGRVTVVAGGDSRAESVVRGLGAAGAGAGPILVHDAVRPFVSADVISRVLRSAHEYATIPVVPVSDTIKQIDPDGWVVSSPARETLRAAQTPQGFPDGLLQKLVSRETLSAEITDEGVLCERAGVSVRTVPGDEGNVKITSPEDLHHARWLVDTGMIAPPTLP